MKLRWLISENSDPSLPGVVFFGNRKQAEDATEYLAYLMAHNTGVQSTYHLFRHYLGLFTDLKCSITYDALALERKGENESPSMRWP